MCHREVKQSFKKKQIKPNCANLLTPDVEIDVCLFF